MYSGSISSSDFYNSELESVPGEAGNLFFTAGPQGGSQPDGIGFYQSTNQGATWTALANVDDVSCFGFGAAAPGESYPSIFIVGWVNSVDGIWQSTNDGQSWTQIGTYPTGSLDSIKTISGDPNNYGQVYIGFSGQGYAYLPSAPVVTAVASSPSSGTEFPGDTITLTLTMSETVTVTGTPTLSLNDGGTATYISGSGTGSLIFSYTVSSSDSDVSALAITRVNEPNGATIEDANGNAADLAGAVTTFTGLQIDPPSPAPTLTVTSDASATKGQVISLSTLLAIADPSNVGYTALQLWDSDGGTVAGGEFKINGVAQPGQQTINVSAANVANTVFDVGTLGGTDTLWAQLLQNDGSLTGWQEFTVTAPAATLPTLTVTSDASATKGQVISLSTLLAIADPSNVGYTALQLWDSDGTVAGGEFVVNGVAQSANHAINVAPGANVVFDAGTSAGTDALWAQLVQDNGTLSGWQEFTVTVPQPTLTVHNDASATRGQVISLQPAGDRRSRQCRLRGAAAVGS